MQINTEDAVANAVSDSLGSVLTKKFSQWRDMKREVEQEWLQDLRAYSGIYEPGILQKIGKFRSKIYIHLTRTKTQAAYARGINILYGSGENNWLVEPTPIPSLNPQEESQLSMQIFQLTGQQATKEELLAVSVDLAEKTAARMTQAMEDQKIDCDEERSIKTAFLEACMLGSGCVKGYFTRMRDVNGWNKVDNDWILQTEQVPVADCEPVSIFDIYPDPYAVSMRDATGIFQRHILNRQQLSALGKNQGFDKKKITLLLLDFAKGNHTQFDHEIERRRIAGYNTSAGDSERYEVLEYWGQVSGEDLESCGCAVDDAGKDYQANVWVCGGVTIKARINALKPERLPYQIFPYERIPHQFWGIGVPRQMRDSQTTMNTSMRVALDNLAISSGPQTEVNLDLLGSEKPPDELIPWGIHFRRGGDASQPLLRFYQPDNLISPLVQIMEIFRRFADEETNLPSYTHGEQTGALNKTKGGMAMLMNAADIVTKAVINNAYDDLIKPLTESHYHWNMQFNPDQSIKGDMQVRAGGASDLAAKDSQSDGLMQFAQITANPIDAQFIKRPELLREIANALDVDSTKVIYGDDELQNAFGGGGASDPNAIVNPGMGAPASVPQPAGQPMPG